MVETCHLCPEWQFSVKDWNAAWVSRWLITYFSWLSLLRSFRFGKTNLRRSILSVLEAKCDIPGNPGLLSVAVLSETFHNLVPYHRFQDRWCFWAVSSEFTWCYTIQWIMSRTRMVFVSAKVSYSGVLTTILWVAELSLYNSQNNIALSITCRVFHLSFPYSPIFHSAKDSHTLEAPW